eukprot:TRINITY_DN24853_c0_g1_i1.p1 TRINITY_DN24853_c0_g1~~TRINITY_DN24853_c0_g1_i1.p1  ORF type:complete len:117 (+),score=6.11 TRINITY_DN24853_c0_g1_i1:165-515(+)
MLLIAGFPVSELSFKGIIGLEMLRFDIEAPELKTFELDLSSSNHSLHSLELYLTAGSCLNQDGLYTFLEQLDGFGHLKTAYISFSIDNELDQRIHDLITKYMDSHPSWRIVQSEQG